MKLTATTVIFSLFIVSIYAAVKELPEVVEHSAGLPIASPVVDKKKTTIVIPTTTPDPATTTTTTETPSTTTTPEPTTEAPTKAPTTTSTEAPTTVGPTPAPTPSNLPEPSIGKYILTEGNKTCILLEFAAQLNISYIDDANHTVHLPYNMPNVSSQISGSCGNGSSDQFIVIEWMDKEAANTVNLTFGQKAQEYMLKEIAFNLSENVVPKPALQKLYLVGNVFETHQDKSYHCTRDQKWNLTDQAVNGTDVGVIKLSHVVMEAYHTAANKEFSTAIDCDAMNTPDIVPIAVGIALILLVVIVLIAYIVGRRRAQARGYVSM